MTTTFAAKKHPEETANVFNKFMVSWITPLINTATTRLLQDDDVGECPESESVEAQTHAVWNAWQIELELAKTTSSPPSLARSILRSFYKEIIITGIFQVCFLAFQIAQPYLVGQLVAALQSDTPIQIGIGFAIGLGLVSLCSSIFLTYTFTSARRLGVALRTGMLMATYQQSLRLQSSSRQQNSVGQMVNLMAIDTEKLFQSVQYVHFVWHGPVMSLLVMILLIFQVGVGPALAGMGWISVMIPLQNLIAAQIGKIRQRMIKFTDDRVKLTNEVLQAIRVIKLYCWEIPIENRLMNARAKEMSSLSQYLNYSAFLRELLFIGAPLSSLFIFTTMVYGLNRELTIVQVFQVLSFVSVLRFPLNRLGQSLKEFSNGTVSIKRLEKFFLLPTIPDKNNEKLTDNDIKSIVMSNATFSWIDDRESNDTTKESSQSLETILSLNSNFASKKPEANKSAFALHNINFEVNSASSSNKLIAIIGAVGSGKSTLLSAMLGEVPLLSGKNSLVGRVAYCAQTPWIQNVSLKENVLFGLDISLDPSLEKAYNAALDAAALRPDLEILPAGDLTEIGERGINLSGGQKARVSIARAILAAKRSDIVILDDPFSALDGNTGNFVFEHGIQQALADKIRVVALNSHLHLLPKFDRVVVLENGRIIADGNYCDLVESHSEIMLKYTGVVVKQDESAAKEASSANASMEAVTSPTKEKAAPKKLMAVEKRSKQGVGFLSYAQYFGAAFYAKDSEEAIIQGEKPMLAQVSRVGIDLYLADWATHSGDKSSIFATYYYAAFGTLVFFLLFRSTYLNTFSVLSSSKIHRRVFRKVLSAPIPTFFDTHTVGEVLNRFSKDTETMDSDVPEFLFQVLINWTQILSVFGLCIWASPYFLIVLFPLCFGFYRLFIKFAAVSRDLKRMESTARSPMFASFSETLTGLDTIRAYDDASRFYHRFLGIVKTDQRYFFHLWMCQCWVTARLELATSFILFSISILCIGLRSHISQVTLGLCLSYGLQLTALFQRSVQVTIDVATYMTSTERVLEYLEIESEQPICNTTASNHQENNAANETTAKLWSSLSKKEQDAWPSASVIEFRDVWMKYRDNEPVLRGVSFVTNPAERIGICGRTGAGKSSLMVALFRVCELMQGVILIDGVNIASIPLSILRSRLAIIPQDPVLFTGNVRFQLDPFLNHTDMEILDVLKLVNLFEHVHSLPKGLEEPIYENGSNLSQGQRQLLCIARALLRRAAILVIDEGTSAVDTQTDALIQEALRKGAASNNSTVLAIAHRLQTIVDFDRIVVMGSGEVKEIGIPQVLLSQEESLFQQMYRSHQ